MPTGSKDALYNFLISGAANWRLIFKRDGFYVFVRGQSSPQEWQNIEQAMRSMPQYLKHRGKKLGEDAPGWSFI